MIKTALIRLNQPVSYSSSAQLNIYTAFRPRANTALVRIGQGPKKLHRYRFAILLPFRHYVLHDVIITNMSSDKAVVDSESVAFTNEEAKQILHQFAKEIGRFELDFYNFDCFI